MNTTMNTTTPSLILRKLNEYSKTYECIHKYKPTIFDEHFSKKETLLQLTKMLLDDVLLIHKVKVNVDIIGLGKYDFVANSCERAYDAKTLEKIDIYLISNEENKSVEVNLRNFSNLFITYIEPDLRKENETWKVSICLKKGRQNFAVIELIF